MMYLTLNAAPKLITASGSTGCTSSRTAAVTAASSGLIYRTCKLTTSSPKAGGEEVIGQTYKSFAAGVTGQKGIEAKLGWNTGYKNKQ